VHFKLLPALQVFIIIVYHPNLKKSEDQEILDMLKSESSYPLGFKLLSEKYQRSLYAVIRAKVINHEDAHDVLQNTFLKVHRGISQFRGESKLYSWMYRIAINESLTFLSYRHKRQVLHTANVDDHQDKLRDHGQVDGDQVLALLHQAVAQLPSRQRQIFEMRYFDNKSYQDMADRLELSIGGLKASYHFAVKKIENYILKYQTVYHES